MKLIILTCSISPLPQPDLVIADPETRLSDYVKSLKFWNKGFYKPLQIFISQKASLANGRTKR